MNILFVTAENDRFSGAFLSVAKLADILQRKYGHNVVVILPKQGNGKQILDEKHIECIVVRSGIWVVKVHDKNKLSIKIKYRMKRILNCFADIVIDNIIREKGIDLVHINSSWTYIGARAALKRNVPFVWHFREFLEEDQGMQIWRRNKGLNLMKQATHIIAISSSIYKKYEPILGAEKLSVIFNGIEPNDYLCKNHFILQMPQITLLVIGNIREEKGQIDAIRACILLRERGYINVKLSIIGNGEAKYVQHLKQFVIDHEAESYIIFGESTSNPLEFYKKTDIVLMCSKSEAFGRVTVEGMMAGALVIGAENAATCELIQDGETGFLYTSGNIRQLAGQIAYAVQHPEEARTVARNGQLYALRHFTADINAEKINDLYRNILSTHLPSTDSKMVTYSITDI